MAKKEETIFAANVDKWLTSTFGKSIWLENIQQVGKSGTPDRLLCINGRFVALELKTDKGEPSKIQLLKLAKIKRAKGLAYIVTPDNWLLVLEEIKSICGSE